MKNKTTALGILLIIFTISCSLNLNAQPGSTTGSTTGLDDPFGDEPQDVPLDNNVLLLAATGAAYGLNKVISKKKKNN